MSQPPPPPSPFTSPHLHYRAIRPTHDLPLFTAINADQTGYPNSNISNAKLPGATDALTYLTHCSTATLLGAIIWLPHPPSLKGRFLTNEIARLKRVEDAKGIHGTLVEDCGIAIGEIHLSLLPTHSSHHRHTELGIGILPAWQGCGYGGEAIGWAVEYAFLRVGLHRVGVRAFGWNERAVRLYERLGFCVEGREREAFWWEGGWWDGVLLGVLEGEWRARREGRGVGEVVGTGAEKENGRSEKVVSVSGSRSVSRRGSHGDEGGAQKKIRLDIESAESPFEASRIYVNSLLAGQKTIEEE